MPENVLRLADVTMQFGGVVAVNNLSLEEWRLGLYRRAYDHASQAVAIAHAAGALYSETGFLDADIIASGTTKSTRDRTKSVMDIIKEVSRENQGPAPREDVLNRAEELGIERSKAEEIIDRMRRDGDVFEPRPGMLKLP